MARLDAEEYLERGGPVGAALAALMDRSARSRSRNLESLRVSMMWSVVESALDEARQFLLFDDRYEDGSFDISPDGARFVMMRRADDAPPPRLHVIVNWLPELERLVPSSN